MTSNFKIDIFNTPNILSMLRICVSPVFLIILQYSSPFIGLVSAALFIAVALTDWLDGYLARKYSEVTTLGKFLDPLADKLLVVTALIMLVDLERAPAWIVAVIIARELAVTGLRAVAVDTGVVIAASWLGKLKTVSQIVAIVPLLVHYEYFGLNFHDFGSAVLWVALVATIWSGVDYFYKFFVGASKPSP